jgi:N-methylhydantoinase B
MTNDPYTTGGMVMHLNDIYLFKPIFVDGRLLCFAWTFIHCTDVGGYAPGSIDMRNNEVFQEGLRLRPVKLMREGVLNQELWNIFADNCRIPALNWGDITACIAALDKSERRLARLVERYGYTAIEQAIYATLDRTEQLARQVLARIPKGEYRFDEYFEDDYVSDLPVRITAKLRSHGDGTVTLDFRGSDPQVRAALNLPTGSMRHHPFLCMALTNLVVTQSESIHINGGIIRCIDLVLPEASVVNARFPAACGMRFTTAMRIHDLVLGLLSKAVEGLAPVGGSGAVVITYISTSELGETGRVVVANPVSGGSGGSAHLDGISGSELSVAFLRNVPVEVLESEAPVLVRRFGLRPDTEGAGKHRGGFGTEYDLQIRHPAAVVVMRGKDRHRFCAWGAAGGTAATPSGNTALRPGQPPHDIGKQTVYRPAMNELIQIWSGGGGGWGDPFERDPELVARDVAAELVSVDRARSVYGVVMTEGAVQSEETQALRSEMTAQRTTLPSFDFGAGRGEWEATYGIAAEQVAAWLPTLAEGVRRHAQAEVYRQLCEAGPGPYDAAATQQAIQLVTTKLPNSGRLHQ